LRWLRQPVGFCTTRSGRLLCA